MIEDGMLKNGDTISCICGDFKIVLRKFVNLSGYNVHYTDDIVVCKQEKRKGIIVNLQSELNGFSHLFRDNFELLTVEANDSLKYVPYLLIEKNIFNGKE